MIRMNIRSLFLFIGALGLSHSQTCNETTESLFQIDFAITREEFNDLRFRFDWYLRLDSNFSTIRDGEYSSFDEVPSNTTIHCIPKDECVLLHVTYLRPDQYTIRLDGQVITPGPSFPYIYENITFSTTELGDCIPACGQGEALFELAALTGGRWSSSGLDWRLEDFATRQVLAECTRSSFGSCIWKAWRLYHSRRCLPVDSCYRFSIGDRWWRAEIYEWNWERDEEHERPLFNVTFDGKTIASLRDFRYGTVDFGSGCSAPCNQDDSLLELFLWRLRYDATYPDVSWSFKDGENTLLDGTVAWNDTPLHYIHKCVPSDACLSFTATVPETKTILKGKGTEFERNGTYHEDDPYRLSLDGTIFVDTEYRFGGLDDSREFSVTAALGECTTAEWCDTETESLLDLRFEPSGERSFNLDWYVRYVDEELKLSKGVVASDWDTWRGVIPNLSYRTYKCIPKTDCTEFFIPGYDIDDGDAFKYSIFIDGNKVGSRDCTESKCYGVGDIVTRLGGDNCPSSDLSTGAIVGIAVGSMAGLAVLALLIFKLIRGRKSSATTPIANNESSNVYLKENEEAPKEEDNKLEDVAL